MVIHITTRTKKKEKKITVIEEIKVLWGTSHNEGECYKYKIIELKVVIFFSFLDNMIMCHFGS